MLNKNGSTRFEQSENLTSLLTAHQSTDARKTNERFKGLGFRLYQFCLVVLIGFMTTVEYLLVTQPNALDMIIGAISSYSGGTGEKRLTLEILALVAILGAGTMLYAIETSSHQASKESVAFFSITLFAGILHALLFPFHISNYSFDIKWVYGLFGGIIIISLLLILKGMTVSKLLEQSKLRENESSFEDQEKDQDTLKMNGVRRFLSVLGNLDQYQYIYYKNLLLLILSLGIIFVVLFIFTPMARSQFNVPSFAQLLFGVLVFILVIGCVTMWTAIHKKSYTGVKKAKIAFNMYSMGSILMILLRLCNTASDQNQYFMVMNIYFILLAFVLLPILIYLGRLSIEKILFRQEGLSILQFLLEENLVMHGEQIELVRAQIQALDKKLDQKSFLIYSWWVNFTIIFSLYPLMLITAGFVELVIKRSDDWRLKAVFYVVQMILMHILQIYGCTLTGIAYQLKDIERIGKALFALKINFVCLLIFGICSVTIIPWSKEVNSSLESNGIPMIFVILFNQDPQNPAPPMNGLILYLYHCWVQISCLLGVYFMKKILLERNEYYNYIKTYIPSKFHL